MGASREPRASQAMAANLGHEPAAAVLDFAVAQILRDEGALDALPAVLERLVAGFGLRAAVALQPSPGRPAAMLAAHPQDAPEPALLARIGALSMGRRGTDASAPVQLALDDPAGGSALVAYSARSGGRWLCALALIGDQPEGAGEGPAPVPDPGVGGGGPDAARGRRGPAAQPAAAGAAQVRRGPEPLPGHRVA